MQSTFGVLRGRVWVFLVRPGLNQPHNPWSPWQHQRGCGARSGVPMAVWALS